MTDEEVVVEAIKRVMAKTFWTGVALGMTAGWLVAMVPRWLS
jgi:hypothetical protein